MRGCEAPRSWKINELVKKVFNTGTGGCSGFDGSRVLGLLPPSFPVQVRNNVAMLTKTSISRPGEGTRVFTAAILPVCTKGSSASQVSGSTSFDLARLTQRRDDRPVLPAAIRRHSTALAHGLDFIAGVFAVP
jgi:hypothetical protein